MARRGGIGIIHRFNTIEQQVGQVRQVKRSESFVIENPYTVRPTNTVGQARDLLEDHQIRACRSLTPSGVCSACSPAGIFCSSTTTRSWYQM